MTSKACGRAVAAAFSLLVASAAHGADFPVKPIRVIVTTPSGSGGDFVSRTIANELGALYKQQVVVDNRPGAGGLIGAQAIAAAPPDGYTLGLASTAHVVAPMLQSKPPYRPVDDFTPIIEIGTVTNIVIVSPAVTAKTAREYITAARANPGKTNYLSLGNGTAAHLAAVVFNQAAGIDAVHVPFKTVGDANTALLAGEIHHAAFLVPSATPLIRGGKVRALAIMSDARLPAFPDVPTVGELGMPEAIADARFGWLGPAGMPRELVARLNADIVAILGRPDVRERLSTVSIAPSKDYRPEAYAAQLRAESTRYGALIESLNLRQK